MSTPDLTGFQNLSGLDCERRVLAGGRAVMYRGDNLRLLAAGLLKADAIVADPPYGIGFQHGGKAPGRNVADASVQRNTDLINGDHKDFDPLPWINLAPRTEVKNTIYGGEPRIILFGADHYMQRLPADGTMLAWDKNIGNGADDSFADCEWAWCGKKVKREVFRWLWKGIITQKHRDDLPPESVKGGRGHGAARFARVHVSQKPVELMRWCIEKLKVPAGGVVLDPYMGSGSTGVAALSLGYQFLGVEEVPSDFATACARIEKAAREMGLE